MIDKKKHQLKYMSRRCQAKTSVGQTCARQAQTGQNHCWQHQSQTGGEYQTGSTSYNIINWNIMDHQSTEYSRLGYLEQPDEYKKRYQLVINQIYQTVFFQQKIVHVVCLEEVTPEFIQLLKQNPYLVNWYHLLEHTKVNPSGGSFSLLTMIHRTFPVEDYSQSYQLYYQNLRPKNKGQPSRTQIFLINNQLVLIHLHLPGLPGDFGNQLRTRFLQTSLNYVNAKLRNYTRKVVIGDFNETEVLNVLGEVIEQNNLIHHQDQRPTSFHRFIQHNLTPECQKAYEDKKGNPKYQLHQKVDHLLHSRNLMISSTTLQPPNFSQLEVPYTAQVDPDNLVIPTEVIKCKPYGKLIKPRLISDPTKVIFSPNINFKPIKVRGIFYPGSGWPSDHSMMEYLVTFI